LMQNWRAVVTNWRYSNENSYRLVNIYNADDLRR